MTALALLLAVLLLAIAALHLAWAAGSTFPAASERELVRMVVGFKGQEQMPPPAAAVLVAVALAVAAYVALALASLSVWPFWRWSLTFAGMVLAFVFLARGVAAYLPAWRARVPQQPFARLDRRYYGPLCLVIGAGFTLLATGYTA
ncbi:DUF3995 domain-containing protein [Ciceribacter thiooxidans]|uniref:DUF3995 domain-containing protein n=1 Tax=Ciceribacter thiooxidans TaxID=1969821 RepID=A0ABV7I282_9HYPH|nr:DUF3995 domain-containing protein [Ciceribacter thiooxidans]